MRNITSYSSNNYNVDYGIHMKNCIRTKITNVYSHNIEVYSCNYTYIFNALLTSIRQGIRIIEGHYTYLVNVSIENSQRNGIKKIMYIGVQGESSINIIMKNISVALFQRSGLDFYDCEFVTLKQSRFSAIYSITTGQHLLQSAIVSLKYSYLAIISNCVFMKNNVTSIQAVNSSLILEEHVVFANNQAVYGAVFVLAESSKIILFWDSSVIFQNNSALDYGGVFYIITEEFTTLSTTLHNISTWRTQARGWDLKLLTYCFIHCLYEGKRKVFTFSGNTAAKGGDVRLEALYHQGGREI